MARVARGLYVWVRHHPNCPQTDVFSHRCRCPKQICGIAPGGEHLRRSANTASWERAEILRARVEVERDLFLRQKPQIQPEVAKTLTNAVQQFLAAKRGEGKVVIGSYCEPTGTSTRAARPRNQVSAGLDLGQCSV